MNLISEVVGFMTGAWEFGSAWRYQVMAWIR